MNNPMLEPDPDGSGESGRLIQRDPVRQSPTQFATGSTAIPYPVQYAAYYPPPSPANPQGHS